MQPCHLAFSHCLDRKQFIKEIILRNTKHIIDYNQGPYKTHLAAEKPSSLRVVYFPF